MNGFFSRTGIKERRIASSKEACSDLCVKVVEDMFRNNESCIKDIELIIVATMTPDKVFPNTACILQKKIGNTKAACLSLEVACSGFLYALEVAVSLLNLGNYKNALLIGAEKLSDLINWDDRNTCVLFGDGAGGFFLERVENYKPFYLSSFLTANGKHEDILHIPIGGTSQKITEENVKSQERFLKMNGKEVYKLAIQLMSDACEKALLKAGIDINDIDWVVPHQANIRIINSIERKLNIEKSKIFVNLDKYGNTSSASIPLAFDELRKSKKLKRGDKVLFMALGGGLAWGASIIEF